MGAVEEKIIIDRRSHDQKLEPQMITAKMSQPIVTEHALIVHADG